MHLQRTILIAICVSLICFVHRSYTMNNPELHEGVRKRANDQPSIDQFEEPTLTRHLMCTKEIEDSVAEEFRRTSEEIKKMQKEECKKKVLDRREECISKSQNKIFRIVLLLVGLVILIWILSQLVIFASAETSIVIRGYRPLPKAIREYYENIVIVNPSMIIAQQEAAKAAKAAKVTEATEAAEAAEIDRKRKEMLDRIRIRINTIPWMCCNIFGTLNQSKKVEEIN